MRDRINEALKEAVKAKDTRRATTLRLINAAIKDRDIAARGADNIEGVSDEEIMDILAKMVKQREESADTYYKAGRTELAQQEREEIDIIRIFMPAQLSEAEVKQAVADIVKELDASGLKDMGKIMGALKSRYAGQMDFGKASALVKELLS